jgi:hypothetical protein
MIRVNDNFRILAAVLESYGFGALSVHFRLQMSVLGRK